MGAWDAPGTHMAAVSSGWGPSGRWFKSSRPDTQKAAPSGGVPDPTAVSFSFKADPNNAEDLGSGH